MQSRFRSMLLAFASLTVQAQPDVDQRAIQALVDQEVAAWNAHDAAAFSIRFTEDGSFANILGMTSYGRAPFQRQHERIFMGIYKNSRLAMKLDRVKMLRPDVALVNAETTLSGFSELPAGVSAGTDGALHTRLEMVLVKQADTWWIASFHNVAVAPMQPIR